jgi:hypothetical protein
MMSCDTRAVPLLISMKVYSHSNSSDIEIDRDMQLLHGNVLRHFKSDLSPLGVEHS